ncbi:MAG: cysteine desulfurase [Coriobacteriia bacterium]|nr:cysteine desulfurase [Coriobacteriia bacterium]
MTPRTYLDYAASSPLHEEVLEAMLPWLGLAKDGGFGNSSALNLEGRQARQALEDARASLAGAIGASPPEIVFTSGATESNNALIAGICQGVRNKLGPSKGGNLVVTSAFEHHAVLEPVRALKRDGWLIDYVRPSREGYIDPGGLTDVIETYEQKTACTLVSVMAANNEVGTVLDIAGLARATHAKGGLFHTDAAQALGKTAFRVDGLGVDAASFSAHKIGGPKGVGAFYLRSLTPFHAQMLGGGQEREMRSGTVNVAGAVGFARALELAVGSLAAESLRLGGLRDYLAASLLAASPKISLTIDPRKQDCLPHIVSFLVKGFESADLILRLDEQGFAVSNGSACSTGSSEPSHVLTAMGIKEDQAQTVLRVSLGFTTTKDGLDSFVKALLQIIH